MKSVSIVTVNFNQPKVTEDLLRSLEEVNIYPNLEIIVVDNGSKPDPVPGWIAQYPRVKFVRSDRNTGFAGGNNIGIEHTTGEYLFLINNDTEVTADLIGKLVATMEANPKIGMISPKIHYFDQPGVLQYTGYTPMNYYTARNACIGQFEQDRGQYDSLSGVTGYAHGAAMMIRREALEKAGVMAENYFLYYEELDWCERIRNAGYEIHVDLSALIYHKESVAVGKRSALKEFFMNRNRILFIRKNGSAGQFFIFCCYFLLAVVPRNIIQYIKNKEYNFIPVFLKAITWHFTNKADSDNLGYPLTR
ncbi:glycosyltransferase family 2 protein [Dyadobacter fanqingshengii]|uniref:Glycosyltransferase family 2 protein n=1 Tax=Dyadobacter fanqingshengii TaxID=2906443 RepID=A0A9X1PDT2_9BACT|nr:glycosyltransferase family 2 protein [Dyadobacter fanqingshengii]MCF0041843.1 glycosyltransferase family 2 protein [Dyadobacter fanqingshengii]USJ36448.1 glycosyltransferase family 2 protein [Dyadobacter fanqingshengii]